jgi:CBS domain-containing protein
MAHTRMEFENPGDEFRITVVGPISSFLIAVLFALIAWIGSRAGWGIAVVGVARYLSYINFALAIFNLLPGFPLDGGRLFRAAVWRATGDLKKATRYATNGGKLLGYLLIVVGFVSFFFGNLVGGIWLVLIGWFIRSAAESSYLQLVLRRSLAGVRAKEAMSPHPYTVRSGISLQEFVDEHVFQGRHHAYPVVDDGRVLGIVSLERVKQIPRDEWARHSVAEAMAPAAETLFVDPDEDMNQVIERLSESPTRRILVSRDGALLGIITSRDVAHWLEVKGDARSSALSSSSSSSSL